MNKYEIVFIVASELDEAAIKSSVSALEKVFKDMKAEIIDSKDLGQKKLAYPIKKSVRGYYYLYHVLANAATVEEFARKAKLDNNILRHLIIREEE
jgi:small subunit ribosomal protein S6